MKDVVQEFNEIIENAVQNERKEEAFSHIFFGVSLSTLCAAGINAGERRLQAIDSIMHTTTNLLKTAGFKIQGQPNEFEAKFKIILLRILLANNEKEMEESMRFLFDNLIWNICLFDVQKEVSNP